MKFGALALLAAGASAASSENSLMKGLSGDVTIDHIAASLDELCHRQGSPACDKTLGEIVRDEPSFCDTRCPLGMSRAQPHQSFLQNDLEEALGMKQRSG